jgi:hypothetical protein
MRLRFIAVLVAFASIVPLATAQDTVTIAS